VKGRIEAYPLSTDKKAAPWYYQSSGRAMVAPLATPETVVWTTDAGYLYVGNADKRGMRYRMETGSDIVAPPSYLKPYVYVASTTGEVFAMQEDSGVRRWKYSGGFPIERPAAPVGKRVFVTTAEPTMHCIEAETGNVLWEAPGVEQFAAASKGRVYGVDDLGGLVILDGAKGSVLGRIAMDRPIQSLVNDQTDRLYLISREGVVECLRETDSKEPFLHNPKPPTPEQPAAGATPATAPATKPAPSAPATTGDAGDAPAAEPATEEQPEKPAGNFGVEDSENPFGE
jgi:PQQ-like domain